MIEGQEDKYRAIIKRRSKPDENGCWIWQGCRARNGYGSMSIAKPKRTARAHRVSFVAFNGPAPDGMDVCHRCDVRWCVNPSHLFLGTRAQNIGDAAQKGRLRRTPTRIGSDHPAAKLTEDKVREILVRIKHGASKRSIARAFGVTQRVILLISRGEIWKHVERKAA